MFTNLNTDPNKRRRLFGEFGALSHTKVSSGEFKYSTGTEIFGEAEPADYIYQVIEGRGSEPQAHDMVGRTR
jgi:CRP/FNR family transcriptional regulator, nitrogen fixation regulation protein